MPRGLRVMIVGPYPVGETPVGGVESAVQGLTQGLDRHSDVEQVLVADIRSAWSGDHETAIGEKCRVRRIHAQSALRLPTRSVIERRRVARVASDFAPDIVHAQGIGFVGQAAVGLGYPIVATVHGMVHLEERAAAVGLRGRLRVHLTDSMVGRVLTKTDGVISISEYDRRELNSMLPPLNARIPNAVRDEFFASGYDDPGSVPAALYSGVLIPRKNIVGLIRAFDRVTRKVRGAELRLAGASRDPAYMARINQTLDSIEEPGSIRLLGSIDSARMAAELRSARAMVLFSHQETLPCTIAEAMASGCPVVSSNVGGIAEMIEHGVTGFLVSDGDEAGLADALMALLGNPGLSRKMGQAARSFAVREYGPDSVAERTVEVYRRVLRSRGSLECPSSI